MVSPQSGHEASKWPSTFRAARMPKASYAQFPYHCRPAARTRYAVGAAENGLAILILLVPASRTSACASCKRRHLERTSFALEPDALAIFAAVGARFSARNRP